MTGAEYRYRVTLEIARTGLASPRVIDGDTIVAVLDLGFRLTTKLPIRLYPWDCPELRSPKASPYEKQQAKLAAGFAIRWFEQATGEIWVTTQKDPEVYGRWLGDFQADNTPTLGEALEAAGLATRWPTRWYQIHDPQRGQP